VNDRIHGKEELEELRWRRDGQLDIVCGGEAARTRLPCVAASSTYRLGCTSTGMSWPKPQVNLLGVVPR
jgi:hypothetical protein